MERFGVDMKKERGGAQGGSGSVKACADGSAVEFSLGSEVGGWMGGSLLDGAQRYIERKT